MTTTDAKKSFFNSPAILITAFIFSALYLIYLALIAQMIIFHDAIGYESLGKLIVEKGFREFLVQGPQREPMYPILIALSMKLANVFQFSYQDVLKFLQIMILLTTQVLVWRVCKVLRLSYLTTALAVLYLVLSPKIVNSALICYSEIATFPWLLAIVLCSAHAWMSLKEHRRHSVIIWSSLLGFSFTCATLTKGVFLLIFPLFMLPLLYATVVLWKGKEYKLLKLALTFLVTVSLTYQVPIYLYKLANKNLNGQFTISDSRGSWALYGNTTKRVEPKTDHDIKAAIVYAIGSEICNKYFSLDECLYWSASRSDYLGTSKLFELEKQGLSQDAINKALINLSVREVFKDPIQYTMFYALETIKVFFWDFRDIAYVVAFPTAIEPIYANLTFQYTMYFLVALLTLVSIIYLICFLYRNLSSLKEPNICLLSQMFLLVLFYNFAYALFFIDPRHILPLGPIYVLVIAWMIENGFKKKSA